jgi:hypothetical protein
MKRNPDWFDIFFDGLMLGMVIGGLLMWWLGK